MSQNEEIRAPDATAPEALREAEVAALQRLKLSPTSQLRPIRAAWSLGRLWNEQRDRLRLSWLMFGDYDPQRTADTWTDMSAMMDRIFCPAPLPDALRQAIEGLQAAWESDFQSEWHSDRLWEADQALQRNLENGDFLLAWRTGRAEYIVSETGYVVNIFKQFEDTLAGLLPSAAWAAFQLGQRADELVHPPFATRIQEHRIQSPPPTQPATMWSPPIHSVEMPERLLLAHVRPSDPLPADWLDESWIRSTEHLIARCLSCWDSETVRPREMWTIQTPVTRMMQDLEFLIADADPDCGEFPVDPETGRRMSLRAARVAEEFGLNFDHTIRHIHFPGEGVSRRFSPIFFRLLIFLLDRYPQPTPTQTLCELWQQFSPRRSTPLNPRSLRAQISRLNQECLHQSGFEVRSDGGGYYFTRIRDTYPGMTRSSSR